ncbi:FKBP-type peptidyl-prolyl cis-trans isomerase [Shewanella japonica]|uniref:FKBP-type peptidyl-prolyl cis-trans isomerase n=1 Tax=Shewanella japonica TaxID=93973 RepID=UPI003CD0DCB7
MMKTMMKKTCKTTSVALLCSVAFVTTAASSQQETENVSYALGASVGKYISSRIYDQTELGGDITVDTVIKGVVDALKDETSMSDEDILTHLNTRAEMLNKEKEARLAALSSKNLAEGRAFLASNKTNDNIKVTESGLQYEIITQGEGKVPLESDVVTVHYKGQLIDGTQFDNSYERNETNRFPLLTVIDGWKEGIGLMPEGSTYRLTIPTELAYGNDTVGIIPPNSVLIFDVELLKVESPSESSHGMGLSGMGMGGMMGSSSN